MSRDAGPPALDTLIESGNSAHNRARLVEFMREQSARHMSAIAGSTKRSNTIRGEMRGFADSEIVPHAHEWHLGNKYIPEETDRTR